MPHNQPMDSIVFWCQRSWANDVTPDGRGRRMQVGQIKIGDFRQISRDDFFLSSKPMPRTALRSRRGVSRTDTASDCEKDRLKTATHAERYGSRAQTAVDKRDQRCENQTRPLIVRLFVDFAPQLRIASPTSDFSPVIN